MNFIIDFYKELETLDLIIFWGIIIVIILLLIFSIIMINKNKKLKSIVEKNNKTESNNNKYEELPIKQEERKKDIIEENKQISETKQEIDSITLPEIPKIENENLQNIDSKQIETEKKFIAEEHVMEYNKDIFSLSNIKKANEAKENINNYETKAKTTIEIPTKPYQRNVLREMSLSQTSPIGITRPVQKEEKKIELAKDLEESLNTQQEEIFLEKNNVEQKNEEKYIKERQNESEKVYKKEYAQNKIEEINKLIKKESSNYEKQTTGNPEIKTENIIKKELSSIDNLSSRRTEIITEKRPINKFESKDIKTEDSIISKSNREDKKNEKKLDKEIQNLFSAKESVNNEIYGREKEKQKLFSKKDSLESQNELSQKNIDPQVKELFNNIQKPVEILNKKSSSEKYLEEVSRKLAEAEIPDEIERTDYELEQEENAIISYKELMEKKDSIQTIDEEEAIISIEELMNRNHSKEETVVIKEDTKLYNLTEEEENDDFIKELKQFRNDL